MCLTEFDEKKYEDVLREEGLAEGRKTEVFMSVQEGDYGVVRGAQKLNLSVEEFEKEMSAAGYQIPVGHKIEYIEQIFSKIFGIASQEDV